MSNNTIILGDIHGRNYWKKIIELHKPKKVIFIGDYFDSYDIPFEKQIENFLNIIMFKQNNPDIEIIMLIGNHDYHYSGYAPPGEIYSGYDPKFSIIIQHAIRSNINHLTMAYLLNNTFLCTHAGVSNTFIGNLEEIHKRNRDGQTISDYLNEIWKYKPENFAFNGFNPYGDNITQSCIWIRPNSLFKDKYKTESENYIQVVGHTKMEKIKHPPKGIDLYFIDNFDTHCQYLSVDNDTNEVSIYQYYKKKEEIKKVD